MTAQQAGLVLVDCTCRHEFEDHAWSHCEVEYCDCEGGWGESAVCCPRCTGYQPCACDDVTL